MGEAPRPPLTPAPSPFAVAPVKARLCGPIRAHVNLRHGVWAPRLRCRKRKNLHACAPVLIDPACSLEELLARVRAALPPDFLWNERESPLRYQAVNDQSLQSLKIISRDLLAALPPYASLYDLFDTVRNRRSDGEGFELQLYVYGTWLRLIRMQLNALDVPRDDHKRIRIDDLNNPPPPAPAPNAMMSTFKIAGRSHAAPPPATATATAPATATATATAQLPATLTLDVRVNGALVPLEVSRQSLLAALQAVLPRQLL